MKKMLLSALLVIFLFTGCSKKPEETKSADVWLKEGLTYFEKGKYKKAAEAFEKSIIEADNPEIAAQAQIFLADSYFFLKNYEEAIPSYEEYLDIYPDSEYAKQALHRLALCYYSQIDTIDRDQTPTKKALENFTKLNEKYPEYAKNADVPAKIKELREMLAEREYYVAKFYLRTKKYKAAEMRFTNIVKNFRDTEIFPKAAIDFAKYMVEYTNNKTEAIYILTEALKNKNGQKYLSEVSSLLGKLQEDLKVN
ncbi:MAG: outer membrane protein assembly factor BamD [Deferribacteres bacterium]|jgi:outer membrane protein assembly factor BamD|nr:outer membrane protein assembly factor BamD [Deferribacteres bacterium]